MTETHMIAIVVALGLAAIWLIFYFYSDRIVVLGVGVGRAYKPVAACADALAQGAAIEDRIVDDRGNEKPACI